MEAQLEGVGRLCKKMGGGGGGGSGCTSNAVHGGIKSVGGGLVVG